LAVLLGKVLFERDRLLNVKRLEVPVLVVNLEAA